MILRQVRKHRHVELRAGGPVESQRMGRHFHHQRIQPGLHHPRKQGLQFQSTRRRMGGRDELLSDKVAHRPDEANPSAGRFEHGFHDIRCRRFSVGARHADHSQRDGRVAIETGYPGSPGPRANLAPEQQRWIRLSRRCSMTTAAAPAAKTELRKSCPSTRSPFTATKRDPGSTFRESSVRLVMVTRWSPIRSSTLRRP